MKKVFLCSFLLLAVSSSSWAKGDKPAAVVYVDPALGGTDQGSVREDGVSEKDINLLFAQNFQLQAAQKNVSVEATRMGDENVTSRDRVSVTKGGNGIFISFQTNFSEDAAQKGIVICVADAGSNKELSMQLAEKIKSKLALQGVPVTIQEKCSYVLKNCSVPSVVVEPGYLSNATEQTQLTCQTYINWFNKQLLSAIVD